MLSGRHLEIRSMKLGASCQVPLLLRLGEDSRALQRSMESGQTDLVYLVLFSLYRKLALQDFVKAISIQPKVQKLFLSYCSQVVRLQSTCRLNYFKLSGITEC